ncbi:hypothetical protein [Nocardia sp. NPDC060249]|uniref:hypothetical protein n=1 Tax=Nocardia sp. NPDC060249 TaxID=3347082 RepID=UPI0036555A28
MIRPVTYYEAICDKCGVSAHEGGDISAWGDAELALEDAEGCDWVTPGSAPPGPLTTAGRHYCPECAATEEEAGV